MTPYIDLILSEIQKRESAIEALKKELSVLETLKLFAITQLDRSNLETTFIVQLLAKNGMATEDIVQAWATEIGKPVEKVDNAVYRSLNSLKRSGLISLVNGPCGHPLWTVTKYGVITLGEATQELTTNPALSTIPPFRFMGEGQNGLQNRT